VPVLEILAGPIPEIPAGLRPDFDSSTHIDPEIP